MKDSFRQSMVWLHTWVGLTAGWVLYFVFLTGTTAFLHFEISRWMRPELPLHTSVSTSDSVAAAQKFLSEHAPNAQFWVVLFPGQRGVDELTVSWRRGGDVMQATLDPRTGARVERKPRATGGGTALYIMHYALHYFSRDVGVLIVGVAAMIMLISILTGVVAHKKIFTDFFTFQPGRGPAAWRSAHTILGAIALPFHLMITWSGLIIFLFLYMPVAQRALFPDDVAMMRFNQEAFLQPNRKSEDAATLTSIPEVLKRAEELWGPDGLLSLRIDNPGRADARVSVHSRTAAISGETHAVFDAATGEAREQGLQRTGAGMFYATMIGLHEGHFARPYLRFLYVIGGLAGTALMGTGLVLWTAKRKSRAGEATHRGAATVDMLNLGTIIGLPIGIAAYFWANRLLPLDIARRGDWEINVLFIVWAMTFLYAFVRNGARAWVELPAVAAAAYGLIPVVNALTTDRHLGVTLPAGDWVLAGFDLSGLLIGVFFAGMARLIRRKGETASRAANPIGGVETA